MAALFLIPITALTKTAYRHRMGHAEALIRDASDAELLALALELQFPIWSQDKDFLGTGVPCFNTAQLAALLSTLP